MARPRQAETLTYKIPPVKVLSDDCTVYIGRVIEDGKIKEPGTGYKVHEGEWVELFPAMSLAEIKAITDIAAAGALDKLCDELSKRIVSWNWTDNFGVALAQPHKNPDVIFSVTDDELMWLLSASKGEETANERKNA